MNVALHKYIKGRTSVKIAGEIESAASSGRLASGGALPTVRALAAALKVSPATVAAAYRALQMRGLLVSDGRRGSRLSHRPFAAPRPGYAALPPGVRNFAAGNPDPALLPPLGRALGKLDASHVLYGAPTQEPGLADLAAKGFRKDGIPAGSIAVVAGALDGIERVLRENLRPGDRVAVEDPSFPGVTNLVSSMGMSLVPVAIDDSGMIPDSLQSALDSGVHGLIVTPRAQNPFGSALDARRAAKLRAVLRPHPRVLLLEDDHAGLVAGAPAQTLVEKPRERWAVVRSFSKALGPDLRLAVMAGDATTLSRVQNRQVLGMRWVSHLLQRLVFKLLEDEVVQRQLKKAEETYRTRRDALIAALAARGIAAHGRSGLNVWISVTEEASTLQALLAAGWAASPGERFRIASPPAIRFTITTLKPEEAERVADDLARILRPLSEGAAV